MSRRRPAQSPNLKDPRSKDRDRSPALPKLNRGALGHNSVADDGIRPEANTGLSLNLKDKPGRCRVCGAPFMGPGNRKYCEEHSPSIKYRGRV